MKPALDIFDPSSYPTRRDEEWKYSDLSRVLREAPKKIAAAEFDIDYGGEWTPDFPIYEVFDGDYAMHGGLQNVVEANEGALWLRHYHAGQPSDVGFQGGDHLILKDDESLVLFETYVGEAAYAAHTSLSFTLGNNAKLIRVVILHEPKDAVSIRQSTVTTAPGSVFKQYVFSTGAKFQRFETHVQHAGHGAEVELNGAYLLKDKCHFDLTTRVTHGEIDGTTAQLIKGLVKDSATAVFQGRILVEKGADGTDARMRHQALILNDGAHVRAKPELEIYADDVQCAHGNTIGALDEDAMFFAMSRGIPEDTARAMLMHAFVLPVAEAIEDKDLRATVLNFLEKTSASFHLETIHAL